MFEIGQMVIDTKKDIASQIEGIIDGGSRNLYVLWHCETGEYYITDEHPLIPLDNQRSDEQKEEE